MSLLITSAAILVAIIITSFFYRKKIYSAYKIFKLWLADTLADSFNADVSKVKSVLDRGFKIIKLWVLIWPIVGATWLSFKLDIIKGGFDTFFVACRTSELAAFGLEINWHSFFFFLFSFIWMISLVFVVLVEERVAQFRYQSLQGAIFGSPNLGAFKHSRLFYDELFDLEKQLRRFESEYLAGEFKNIDELIVFVSSVIINIRSNAAKYFDVPFLDNVNVMLYLQKDNDENSFFSRVFKQGLKLYYRCDADDKLEGVLYIDQMLVDDIKGQDSIRPILIPIYSDYNQVYKNPNDTDLQFILPGAQMAFNRGTSMIGDTFNIKKYYADFDEKTQKEVRTYFSKQGMGQAIRSIASFRIPSFEKGGKSVGVLNLHSRYSYAFGDKQDNFACFYTLIYPALKILSNNLDYYKKSIDG